MREDEAIVARGRASEYTPAGDSNRSTSARPVKAVIFDLGGVIVRWSNDTTYGYIAEKYGMDPASVKAKLEEKLPAVDMGRLDEKAWMADAFRALGMEPPEGYERIWGETFEGSKYNDDTVDIIKKLRRNGYRLAILSNIEPSRGAWERKRGTTDHFDVVVFSYETGMRKVDSLKESGEGNIYRLVLGKLGLEPEECVYVDDNPNCIKGAEDVGMRAILFKNGKQLAEDLEAEGVRLD